MEDNIRMQFHSSGFFGTKLMCCVYQSAVQVLGLVQEILPAASSLINQVYPAPPKPESGEVTNGSTPQHYALLESDHPYKPATVANYKVSVRVERKTFKPFPHTYWILHELLFDINVYESSSDNVVKRPSGKLHNVFGISLIKVYFKKTTNVRFPPIN